MNNVQKLLRETESDINYVNKQIANLRKLRYGNCDSKCIVELEKRIQKLEKELNRLKREFDSIVDPNLNNGRVMSDADAGFRLKMNHLAKRLGIDLV